ncbi:unnamed protein product [Pedinophyceae sp. YPF-701]|nr:unnamed protein product [Pedinophyceae sp. YPF-701]
MVQSAACPMALKRTAAAAPAGVLGRRRAVARPARATAEGLVQPSTVELGARLREDFPILHQEVNGKPLVYLDNAATSQKPTQVFEAMSEYYKTDNSNVHRGVHALAARATASYEGARAKVAAFVNAPTDREIVFTRGATEAINLVANTWGAAHLGPGDEVVLTVMEHHSNLVPWQLLAQRTGCVLKFCRITETQELDMDHMRELIVPGKTKLVACVHVSNMLGCVNPVEDIADMAHEAGAKLLVDACQSVPHMPVDVQALRADWLVASAHKMCGPTGIGFLWGSTETLESMPPWQGGGEMIQDVFLDHSTFSAPPARFEAGTPAIAEAIGFGAACDYMTKLDMARVHDFEQEIGAYLYERLSGVEGVTIYGPPPDAPRGRASLCSFNVEGLHATDVSTLLDASGLAVRSGHHCTQPLHRELGVPASARASLYVYNTREEVDMFVDGLKEAVSFFRELGM